MNSWIVSPTATGSVRIAKYSLCMYLRIFYPGDPGDESLENSVFYCYCFPLFSLSSAKVDPAPLTPKAGTLDDDATDMGSFFIGLAKRCLFYC